MNYLKGKKVYLSGSISKSNNDGVLWREKIKPKLNDFGIEVLDPCDKKNFNTSCNLSEISLAKKKFRDMIKTEDWTKLKKEFWPIVRIDLKMVDHSDFLIFNYEPEIPTVGTIHELAVANFEKKVILLKYKKEDLDHFNAWISTFIKEHHFFSEWQGMFDYLKEVDKGKIDTSYWIY